MNKPLAALFLSLASLTILAATGCSPAPGDVESTDSDTAAAKKCDPEDGCEPSGEPLPSKCPTSSRRDTSGCTGTVPNYCDKTNLTAVLDGSTPCGAALLKN